MTTSAPFPSAALGQFSETVGAIYDAALDRSLWFPALERICAYLGSRTAVINSYDVLDRNPPWDVVIGYDRNWLKLLQDRYQVMNPYMAQVTELACGEADYCSGRADYQAILETPFYREWLKPQGLSDGAVLVIDKTMTTISTLVSVRSEDEGLFTPEVYEKFSLLFPHLRRSILIGRTISQLEGEKAEIAGVLDRLTTGVLVLGASGRILRTNAAADAMLDTQTPIDRWDDRLRLPSSAVQPALDRALAAMTGGDAAAGDKGVSIPLRGGARPDFLLHVLPLDIRRRHAIHADRDAIAVAFVRAAVSGHAEAIAQLAARSGLTRREEAVLQALVDIGGVPMVAEVLGISQTTVRTHVTRIFDKTGVRRQADLIRLLAEMPPAARP